MKVPKIIEVKIIGETTLFVAFNNGKFREYDVTPLLSAYPFSELKNQALFKSVHVEQGGHALVWSDRVDLSEYEVWKNGVEPNRVAESL